MNAQPTATANDTTAAATEQAEQAGTGRRTGILVATLAALVALLATLLAPATAQAATRHTATPVSTPVRRTAAEVSDSTAVLNLMNSERRAHHLPALTVGSQLITSARRHNLAMAHADLMSHQVAGEADLGHRIDAAGYHWSWNGENIGYNSDMSVNGVLVLQKMMYNEVAPNDGHRRNILSRNFRNAGVDVYVDTTHHQVWLTVDFGSK